MALYICNEVERWPVLELAQHNLPHIGVELSDDFVKRYNDTVAAFNAMQDELAKLFAISL